MARIPFSCLTMAPHATWMARILLATEQIARAVKLNWGANLVLVSSRLADHWI